MENNTNKTYGKVVNFWVPQYQDFDESRPNISVYNKRTLVTLYKEGDNEIRIYVSNNWVRVLNKGASAIETIYSVGISEDFNYSTQDLNPDWDTKDINDKYLSISGKLLIELFEKKDLKTVQEKLYGGFIPKRKPVLQSLKALLDLSDDQITEFAQTKKPEVISVPKPTKTVDLEAEQKAAEELAKLDNSDELSF